MLSEEEYPLLETKEMSDRKKELEKLNKENIIQKLVGTEETLKFYIDLYNKEKEKNIELQNYMKEYLIPKSTINLIYISKDKLRKFIKEDSFEGTYNFETISKKNLLKFLEDNV